MNIYGEYIGKLIDELARLPGIGRKSAARLAFHIINMEEEQAEALASAITNAKKNVLYCKFCCCLTDVDICNICANSKRDHSIIMVVEDSRDMAAYERTNEYRGLYHVLQGVLSPMMHVGPDNLRIKELLTRVNNAEEIILATNPNVEGEATAMYISKLLKGMVKVTRIARGVPIGGDLEYVDEITLVRALEGRREV